ncbi:hypothetical protein [Geomicrobium sp. JCM 19039]|uniref:hypothetical protein n=1 Tax=Geomicrobium sp. JCM 19039 TaxID=1460636 RepID=UPI00045F4AC7|nr:hypothetical protein [Geomicrobium sp. JCM 19039]GAK11641.1 hypothetical protein JCM19039_1348 [Geomicrobium sp. JCM 19039]
MVYERELVKQLEIVSGRIVFTMEHSLYLIENQSRKATIISELKQVLDFYKELDSYIPRTGDNSEIGNVKARLTRARRGIEEVISIVELGYYSRAQDVLANHLLPASKRFLEHLPMAFSLEPNA